MNTTITLKKELLLIFILTLVYIAGGYGVRAVLGPSAKWLDPDSTGVIGNNICEFSEFSVKPGRSDLLRGPAYPGALAIPCKISGIKSVEFAPIINGICYFLTLLLILYHPLGNIGKAGLIGVLAVGVDPLLFSYGGRTYVEPMFILSVAMVITAIDRLVRRPDVTSAIILGVVWGGSLLVKSTLIYLPIFLIPVLLVMVNRRSVLLVIISVVIGLLVISPWSYRNYEIMHKYVPVQIGSWQIMHKGNTFSNHVLEGKYATELEGLAKQDLNKLKSELGIHGLPLHEREDYYRNRIIENIKSDPVSFIQKLAIQSITFWILGGDFKNTIYYIILQIPLLVITLVAIWKWYPTSNRAFVGVLIVSFYLIAAHAASLAIARYSMPLRPWLILISVNFLVTYICSVYSPKPLLKVNK
jgi:4-amino-4-deoxy-L-arabinose transferase-like glycosyltransferase